MNQILIHIQVFAYETARKKEFKNKYTLKIM